MPVVRIIRFTKYEHQFMREEFKFQDPELLLSWWKKEDKDKNFYYTVHSLAVPPSGDNEDEDIDWCPYCHDYREFTCSGTGDETIRCPICYVTENEFYVRKYNDRIAHRRGELDGDY